MSVLTSGCQGGSVLLLVQTFEGAVSRQHAQRGREALHTHGGTNWVSHEPTSQPHLSVCVCFLLFFCRMYDEIFPRIDSLISSLFTLLGVRHLDQVVRMHVSSLRV